MWANNTGGGFGLSMQTLKDLRCRSVLTILSFLYTLAGIALLHFLRPEISDLKEPISTYAVGPFGQIMTTAFYAMALGTLLLATTLFQRRTSPHAGIWLLTIVALSAMVAAIFPTDVPPELVPKTFSGWVHMAVTCVGMPAVVIAALLFACSLRLRPALTRWDRLAIILALTMLVNYAILVLQYLSQSPIVGLVQRCFIVQILLWLIVMAMKAYQGVEKCHGSPALNSRKTFGF